jgi:hypothetical protein
MKILSLIQSKDHPAATNGEVSCSLLSPLLVITKIKKRLQGRIAEGCAAGSDFLRYDIQNTGNKSKNRQVRLYQTKNLLPS